MRSADPLTDRRREDIGNAKADVREAPREMKTALLFDLDGTLVDSDPEHLVAFQRVFAPHGIELDHSEYAAKIMGASNAMIASRYLAHLSPVEQAATLDAKEADYRDNLGALEPILGALALLDFADRRGLKRAVVTNAPRANAEKVLAALGIGQRLPILVIGGRACALQARSFALSDGARAHGRVGGVIRSPSRIRCRAFAPLLPQASPWWA